jgi:hypothetical protein
MKFVSDMKNKFLLNNFYVTILLLILGFSNCRHNQRISLQNKIKIYARGHDIIKEIFDSTGQMMTMQSFNKDTIPNGAQTTYYSNGKIRKWKWFKNDTIALCGAYYDSNGICYAFRGNPFLKAGNESHSGIYVTMVTPPTTKFITIFRDSFKNKIVNQLTYEPVNTDSNSYIVIKKTEDEFKYKEGHTYTLCFYIVDSEYTVLAGGETALEFFDNRYDFITAPSLPKKILIK